MNTTPNCLYCGTTMKPDRTFMSMLPAGERPHFWYLCGECGSRSPAMRTQEAAKAAALQRYVEPLKPMTLEEYAACDDAVYLELAGRFADRSRWKEPRTALSFVYFLMSDSADGEKYGMNWRCWLRRPTDAERSAVKWGDAP